MQRLMKNNLELLVFVHNIVVVTSPFTLVQILGAVIQKEMRKPIVSHLDRNLCQLLNFISDAHYLPAS